VKHLCEVVDRGAKAQTQSSLVNQFSSIQQWTFDQRWQWFISRTLGMPSTEASRFMAA
jgi:hypothetical protein